MKSIDERMKKYISVAESFGVLHAVAVTPDEIVFDGRTVLKCMFGCSDWGTGLTCPSRKGSLMPWDYEPLLRKYSAVLILHSNDKKTAQEASFVIEREAYFDGDALAFSMSDCALCERCAGNTNEQCRNIRKARPAFHSVGIDVFTTINKLGLPLSPLKEEDETQNWYSAVWLN